jgi:PTS system mannose-specific IIC component
MNAAEWVAAGAVAVWAGLDRTAAFQLMLARPVVAAPLAGWAAGDAAAGLQAGLLVELLWLGRLPVGAAIPPDDTQVAVGSTVLAIALGPGLALPGLPLLLLCVLVAMPLGKVGQLLDHQVRSRNSRLQAAAEAAVARGDLAAAERCHRMGVLHFALAALTTFAVIVGAGFILVPPLARLLAAEMASAARWLALLLPLLGASAFLAAANPRRAPLLFGGAFLLTMGALWLR